MTEYSGWPQNVLLQRRARSAFLSLSCAAVLLTGCSIRKRPAIPWNTAVQVKPVMQTQTGNSGDLPTDPVPDLRLELPPFPLRLISMRSAPPRPRVLTPTVTNAGTDAEKREAPMIAPQLSPQEAAVAEQQANQSLGIAKRNLESSHGKKLNPAQSDLVSKIRGFLKDAREAARISDWARARSLAKKAEVLSEELAGSL
jgi:hypothetical protein